MAEGGWSGLWGRGREERERRETRDAGLVYLVVLVRSCRMLKMAVQQGPQAEQEPEAYPLGYVEDSCEMRTPLAGIFSILP